jgi:hypothetical protein
MINRIPKSKAAPRTEYNHNPKHLAHSLSQKNNHYKNETQEDKFCGVLKYTKNPYGEEQYKKMTHFIGIRVIPTGQPCIIHIYKKTIFFYKYNNTKAFRSLYVSTLNIPDNTTLLATMMEENKCCIHDLIYSSGKYQESNVKRLEILLNILKNNISTLNKETKVMFGMCYLFYTWQEFINKKEQIYYSFSIVEYITTNQLVNKNGSVRFLYKFKSGNTSQEELATKEKQFYVKPDLNYDIYYLYDSLSEEHNYEIAHIPDYKTSVMMNSIFRKIKENSNLDLLEESDDEDEFEDCRVDKYVYLDKIESITCEYNCKNKKWVPKK